MQAERQAATASTAATKACLVGEAFTHCVTIAVEKPCLVSPSCEANANGLSQEVLDTLAVVEEPNGAEKGCDRFGMHREMSVDSLLYHVRRARAFAGSAESASMIASMMTEPNHSWGEVEDALPQGGGMSQLVLDSLCVSENSLSQAALDSLAVAELDLQDTDVGRSDCESESHILRIKRSRAFRGEDVFKAMNAQQMEAAQQAELVAGSCIDKACNDFPGVSPLPEASVCLVATPQRRRRETMQRGSVLDRCM